MQFVRTQAPLPKTVRTVNPNATPRESKYDFGSMKVGDCDLTNDFGGDEKKAIARLSSAIAIYKRKSGDKRQFAVRVFTHDELKERVLGVWCQEAKEPKKTASTDAVTDPAVEAQADLVTEAQAAESTEMAEATQEEAAE